MSRGGPDSGQGERPPVADRLRSGLRRHGVVPRPAELRRLLGAPDALFTPGNRIALYTDGRSALEAMLEAIAGARRRVHLETYIFRGDTTGRRFVRALAERAAAGVEVRLLYDAFGSLGLEPWALAELRGAGGDVVAFNPLGRLWPRWAPRRRDHRKILVVDGELAFTGGLNIGDEYALGSRHDGRYETRWRDAHMRVAGPAVAMLDAVFLESWFRADGPDRPWTELAAPAAPDAEGESVAVLADGPTYHRRRMRELLLGALARSESHVRIATPYFVPGLRMRHALASAAERGVRVELLLAGWTDHPLLRWAARDRLSELVACGLRAFEYEASMMHAKVAVFDGEWAVLGTSNLDRQSLEHSYEVNLVVHGAELPRRLDAMLEEDMAHSHQVTLERLEQRSLFERLRDRFAGYLLARL